MRKKKALIFVLLCVLIFCYTYFYSTLFNDEIWNYGFSYNIASGLVPYRDFNMIVTPLYSFVAAIFIFVFGHHLWAIHILNAVMIGLMFFMLFKSVGKQAVLMIPIILLYCYPGYNLFSLFLFIIFLNISDRELNLKDYLMGFLCGILFLTKQTIGLCLFIPMLFYSRCKLKSLIGFLIPNMIFLAYLVFNHAVYSFIDYCFLGMLDFSSSNQIYLFLPVEIIVCLVLGYRLVKSHFKDRKLFYVLMYQIMAFPICDDYHFMIAFMAVLYWILVNVDIKSIKLKYYFLIILFGTMSWNYVFNNYGEFHFYSDKKSYLYGRYIPLYVEDSITAISDYMNKEKDNYDSVYLLTQNSYEIKMNTDYQINKFDLINNGNMGYRGSFKYIKELKKNCEESSCMFIVYKYEIDDDNFRGNQTNLDIIHFVYDNYDKQEEVDVFDIYTNT